MINHLNSNRSVYLGFLVLTIVAAMAALAPVFYPAGPWQSVTRPFLPPFTTDGLPLGTDTLGRDVMAQLFYGAQVSLFVGIVSTAVALLVGIPLGAFAGYYGGWVDEAISRFTEFFQTFPSFALAIVLVAIFQPSIVSITLAIAVVSWPPITRLIRAEVMSVKRREYIQAATVAGLPPARILLYQILPNAFSPVIVMASLMVATAILLESSLAFLGLGDPNSISWGYMIGASRSVIRSAWWLSFIPGVAIVITVLAFNLIGDGLSNSMNPHRVRKPSA